MKKHLSNSFEVMLSSVNRSLFCGLMLYCAATCLHALDTGEPGCKTELEVGNVFRHYNDPTKYWHCSTLAAHAVLYRCPDNRAFGQEQKACLPWLNWQWEPTIEPPSRPDGYVPDEVAEAAELLQPPQLVGTQQQPQVNQI